MDSLSFNQRRDAIENMASGCDASAHLTILSILLLAEVINDAAVWVKTAIEEIQRDDG